MLNFLRRKKKKGKAVNDEVAIDVFLGSFPGYSSEDDIDSDPWDNDPNKIKIGGDFVIPSE